jgi:hypothetical protein
MLMQIPDDILYLVHVTSRKYKDANGNLIWTEIKATGTDGDQHPGSYFTLITKDNRLTEELFPATECLIFSRNLLKQHNYHINMCDNNGFITEDNTFFPWDLHRAVEHIRQNAVLPEDADRVNYHRMNEVVFHDPVGMEYLCLDMPRKFYSNDYLPDYPIENEVNPNKSLLPFYCFSKKEENNRYTSSLEFFKKIADFCNVDNTLSKNEIIEKIIEKAPFIYQNRHLQNIDMIRTYLPFLEFA